MRSDGADGVQGTYDDFDVARFPVLLKEESATGQPQTNPQSAAAALSHGTGSISGTVTDPSGAVVPNTTVTLISATKATYDSTTDEEGVFHFASVPAAGVYLLRASRAGFLVYELSRIPVTSDHSTSVAIVLEVGSQSQSVTVEAEAMPLQTSSASLVALTGAAVGTPRVREYFPETLLWIPDLVTDSNGGARTQLTLADSVTTWKIAVFASTIDGRSATTESDLRAFQPFFLDFNPPLVMTEGDQDRNARHHPGTIRDRAQNVSLSLQPNTWSTIDGSATRKIAVDSNSSSSATFLVHAKASEDKARQRNIATSASSRDAIEKSTPRSSRRAGDHPNVRRSARRKRIARRHHSPVRDSPRHTK